jgi:probable F420-dependent oxidoreductase
VKIGVCLPQLGPHCDGVRVASFAQTAEEIGYDSLWVGDRVLAPLDPSDLYPSRGTPEHPYPPEFTAVLDPLITLTAAAAATTSVRLGTSTLNAPWHNPLLLGRALTSLDAVSGGRLDAGFGIGWLRDEYEAVGVPWHERGARLDEILDVLHQLWTENPVEHHGRHFDIARAHVDLRPVQPGGPPILLGGFGARALERVGRRAAGWLASWGAPQEYIDMLWQTARQSAAAAERDPNALRREVRINVAPGQSVDDLLGVFAQLRQQGVDGVFIDLTYATRTVDESLDVAGTLINAAKARG